MWIEKRFGSPFLFEALSGGVWFGLCYSAASNDADGQGYYWAQSDAPDVFVAGTFPTPTDAMRWIKGLASEKNTRKGNFKSCG